MRSLWIDPQQRRFPSLESELDVDVAIIGGGLSGIGAAYGLRYSGMSVALLEERTIASGASGRNAGFLLAGPAMPYDIAVAQVGRRMAEEIWRFTVENNCLISDLIDEWSIECGFLRRGSMSLAASEAEWDEMSATLACLHESSIPACAVARKNLPRPFDPMYFGGIYYAGNAEFDPGRFLLALSKQLRNKIQLYEGTPVGTIERNGDSWLLGTSAGRVCANAVILATNAYATRLFPDIPIAPKRGQVLSTAPLERMLVPFPMYANHGYQYWRQTEDGRLVIGGWRDLEFDSEVGTEEKLNDRIQNELDDFSELIARQRLPPEFRWAGIMGFTPDQLPLVGAVPKHENLWIAAGYSGHGVSMAFICGYQIGTAIQWAGTQIPECFNPARLATAYRG